jgi:hypothetical protein
MRIRHILLEAWGLGDALIAASFLRACRPDTALVCNIKWVSLVRSALAQLDPLRIMGISFHRRADGLLPRIWTTSTRLPAVEHAGHVYSIRGYIRDYALAKKLFPLAKIHMNGWAEFFAWHSRIGDALGRMGCYAVKNRYDLWSSLLNMPVPAALSKRSLPKRPAANPHILIHAGAGWRCRQYPHVCEVRRLLLQCGCTVSVVAAPGDVLPEGIDESGVERCRDSGLIDRLAKADVACVNDSGPMHLSRLLGVSTVAVARVCNIRYWKPPGTETVCAADMPGGYRPHSSYLSNRIVGGWPDAARVAARIIAALPGTTRNFRTPAATGREPDYRVHKQEEQCLTEVGSYA